MIKIPYGISDFSNMPLEQYYYVDRTNYIEKLESRGEKTIMYIRPRRFGKSLFISMLHHYYGMEHQENFSALFGQYYIGQHPTQRANLYLVLSFDFSGIDTKNAKNTYTDFTNIVKNSILNFLGTYAIYFDEKDNENIEKIDSPQGLLNRLFTIVSIKAKGKKLYVLIDEYDHFTNELLSLNFSLFMDIASKNGWVRKFYEVLKRGNGQGIVDRIFMTGVSPVTLDSLTSGFNISSNFSGELDYCEMMGFTEKEVVDLLKGLKVSGKELDIVLNDLRLWYNGYLFHKDGNGKVYNPDMVLYFARYYATYKTYPEDLLDENIAGDYGKIRKMIAINDTKEANYEVLEEIIKTGSIKADLTRKYSFDRPWTADDFVSLLFYTGILSIKGSSLGRLIFSIPNYVIRQLYFQFFYQLTIEDAKLSPKQLDLKDKIEDMAEHNQLQPVIELAQNILAQLGREDKAHFNEVSLKTLFASFFYQVSYYNIFSELEVRKKDTEKGRVDLLLTRRPPFQPTYQFIFELKYLRAKQKGSFETLKKEAILQLTEYLQNDATLKNLDRLKAYVIIFIANEGHAFLVEC